MATANESIRDAMIHHQIGLIRASGTLSKQIIVEQRKSEKEVRKQIERRLSEIHERGFDVITKLVLLASGISRRILSGSDRNRAS